MWACVCLDVLFGIPQPPEGIAGLLRDRDIVAGTDHTVCTAAMAAARYRVVPSQLTRSLRLHKETETWPPLVNPKVAYFSRNFLIGYSIFRREKPFADEKQSC